MNLTVSIGNMTDDPKITNFDSGKKKAEFNLALNRGKEGADFPRFIAWEQRAELIEKYTHKGSKLMVEGHIHTGSYEKEGKKVYTTDVIVDRIEFMDKKQKAENDGSAGQPTENPSDEFMVIPEGMDEELPFA